MKAAISVSGRSCEWNRWASLADATGPGGNPRALDPNAGTMRYFLSFCRT